MTPFSELEDSEAADSPRDGAADVEGQGGGEETTAKSTARIASLVTAASSALGPTTGPRRHNRGFRGAVLRATGMGMNNGMGPEEVMALRQEVSDLKGDIAELKEMVANLAGRT